VSRVSIASACPSLRTWVGAASAAHWRRYASRIAAHWSVRRSFTRDNVRSYIDLATMLALVVGLDKQGVVLADFREECRCGIQICVPK